MVETLVWTLKEVVMVLLVMVTVLLVLVKMVTVMPRGYQQTLIQIL